MQSVPKESNEFLNPYRENKRCFAKYFKSGSKVRLSQRKDIPQNHEAFLDNVSKASSMKFRDQSVDNHFPNQSLPDSSLQHSQFIIKNKRTTNELQNPEMFQLISKHIERTQSTIKKPQKPLLKPAQSLFSGRFKNRSNSVNELEKIPKITQFSRQTFYRNISKTGREYSSKKQIEDVLHSNSNLDINTKKQAICKKTRPYKDNRSFVTYELYNLNKRVGIDVQILAGALKQIKFRLIMNQADTQTFHKHWAQKLDDFIDKCMIINEDGISLKLAYFNLETLNSKKSNLIKNVRKVYLQQYEAFIKRKTNKKVTKKIGHINFSQQYQPDQPEFTTEKQVLTQDLQVESNQKVNEQQNEILYQASLTLHENNLNDQNVIMS